MRVGLPIFRAGECGGIVLLLLIASLMSATPGGAASNNGGSLVKDGGFESPVVSASYQTFAGGTRLGPWHVTGNSVDLVATGFLTAHSGSQDIDLAGSNINGSSAGGVYENLATTPGESYDLTYWESGNLQGPPTVKQLSVNFAGKFVGSTPYTSTSPTSYIEHSFVVVATSTRSRLAFTTSVSTQWGPLLDDVRVVPVAPKVIVTGTDNIFGAGLSVAPDPGGGGAGDVPPAIAVSSGTTWMTFSNVRGTVSDQSGESNGPDGSSSSSGIAGAGEISGIVDSTGVFYLVGVYLDGPQRTSPSAAGPPPSLNFSGNHSFSSLSPELGQIFFIGDGLTDTGSGTEQIFRVPSGATDLYLGFADAQGFQGPPGYYGDNSGHLSLTVNFVGGDAAPIATSLGTPNEIFHSMGHNIVNAGITVGAILFITFPSMIFNQTFSANYGEILLIVGGFRRRVRKAVGLKDKSGALGEEPGSATVASAAVATAATEHSPQPGARASSEDTPGRSSPTWFFGVLVAGAVLGGLLNPQFGINERSIADIGATLIAFALGTLVGWFIAKVFREHHRYPVHTYLHALPLGLLVAGLCVLVSRLSNFEPGYLYGVVVSLAFVETLEERHNAHLIAISSLSTIGVALIAWFLWIPVNHFALEHGHNVILAIADDVLASLFVGGLVGTVIGLLPLEFMPGGALAKWRKDVWAVVFFVALFLLVEVELRPASGPTHPGGAPIVTVVVLFALFGGGTFCMRHFFAQRKARSAAAPVGSTGTPAPNVPEQGD